MNHKKEIISITGKIKIKIKNSKNQKAFFNLISPCYVVWFDDLDRWLLHLGPTPLWSTTAADSAWTQQITWTLHIRVTTDDKFQLGLTIFVHNVKEEKSNQYVPAQIRVTTDDKFHTRAKTANPIAFLCEHDVHASRNRLIQNVPFLFYFIKVK